jgi:hypothetical protein
MRKRIHLLSAVNAANVSKSGNVYTIRDVCGAVDGIVMNSMMYPADQLAAGVATMEGKPSPIGHPKNEAGQFISATNGDALLTAYAGAICRNARHEGGRSLFDVVVNEAQAKAHPMGQKLIDRLDAAITGNNADPIHVSTGVMVRAITANGESRGKKYSRIATELNYDHLAILLNEKGAGTPDDGVGMFLNSEGQAEEVEEVTVNVEPEDKRFTGLAGWIRKLLGNQDISFDQIHEGLRALLPEGAWPREVFAKYVVFSTRDDALYQQDYVIDSAGSLALIGQAVEVRREVTYTPITNAEKVDQVKEQILAALNAAGIQTAGLDESSLLTAYNSLITAPVSAKLIAANSKLAEIEVAANAAKTAELDTLAAELAVNTSLKPEDFVAMGLDRCKELKANAKTAAPVITGNGSQAPAAPYDINKL